MQIKTTSVSLASETLDLKIHNGKSKIIKYNTQNTNPITLDWQTLEEVDIFTYLGSIIDEQGGPDADVNTGIGKTRVVFLQLKNM